MKLPNIMGVVNVVKTLAAAHRPEILLGASVTATVGSTVLAAMGGYKARGIVDEEQARRDAEKILETGGALEAHKLTPKEIAQLTWSCYLPAAAACTTALGSTAGLHLVHVKDKKALVTAGAVALEEVKEEFKRYEKENTVGVMSNEEKQKVLEERAKDVPITDEHGHEASHVQSSDDHVEAMYLVRDGRSGRDLWSNQHRIEDALIEVNNVINGSGNVELNYFYTKAGFNLLPDGTKLGWSGALVDIIWEETVRDDGRPVREFHFRPAPQEGYDDAHQ